MPTPATADRQSADLALAEGQSGQAGGHQCVARRERRDAADARHDQPGERAGDDAARELEVKSAPAAASVSDQRAVATAARDRGRS